MGEMLKNELCIVGRGQELKKSVEEGAEEWQITFPECLWFYLPVTKKREPNSEQKGFFSLHRELLARFKPGPYTRYFICQLWNITNTWQMFNNPALLCLSLSNNTLLGAWFWEAIVQRMWMGGKAAFQKREKQLWQKRQNFCELHSSVDIWMSLPGRWNHQQRVLPKHCLNEEMLHFPSLVVAANCWGS